MSPDDFRALLDASTDAEVASVCLNTEEIPYVFDSNRNAWNSFKQSIASLGAIESEICVIGSARFGFSLKPSNNFRKFQDTSDIDVLVVDEHLFDSLWISLLQAAYPRPPVQVTAAIKEHQKTLYTGWLIPSNLRFDMALSGHRIRAALDFKAAWFDAFKRAAANAVLRHEDVTGRLYRTRKHAELYLTNSISELRRSLSTTA